MTRDKMLKYVESLDSDTKKLFIIAESVIERLGDYDTLSEEFQIACSVWDVFSKRSEESAINDI